MIDAVIAVGVFTALGLCIAGYGSRRSRERT